MTRKRSRFVPNYPQGVQMRRIKRSALDVAVEIYLGLCSIGMAALTIAGVAEAAR